MGVILLLCLPVWFICHDIIGLSAVTTICIIVTMLAVTATIYDINNGMKARKLLCSKSASPAKARLVKKEDIKGNRGSEKYTFEIRIGERQTHIIDKNRFYGKKVIGEWFPAYPVFDKKNVVIDFYYQEQLEMDAKPFWECYVFSVVILMISVVCLVFDGMDIMDDISNIVVYMLVSLFCAAGGTYFLRRYIISIKQNLRVVSVKVVGFEQAASHENGAETRGLFYPILETEVDGEKYRFLSDKSISDQNLEKHLRENKEAYYDEETQEVLDKKNNKTELIFAIILFVLGLLLAIMIGREMLSIIL